MNRRGFLRAIMLAPVAAVVPMTPVAGNTRVKTSLRGVPVDILPYPRFKHAYVFEADFGTEAWLAKTVPQLRAVLTKHNSVPAT